MDQKFWLLHKMIIPGNQPRFKKSELLIPSASTLIVHRQSGKVLFVRSTTTKEKWGYPGGRIDFKQDKNPKDAALREGGEETSLKIEIKRFLGIYITSEYDPNFRIHCFIAESDEDKVKPGREIIEWKWLKPEGGLNLELTLTARQALEDFLKIKTTQ